MAACPRLQRREYQTRIVLWNLLVLMWLAAIAATGVLTTQANAKPLPVHLRITHQPLEPTLSAAEAQQMFLPEPQGSKGLVEAKRR